MTPLWVGVKRAAARSRFLHSTPLAATARHRPARRVTESNRHIRPCWTTTPYPALSGHRGRGSRYPPYPSGLAVPEAGPVNAAHRSLFRVSRSPVGRNPCGQRPKDPLDVESEGFEEGLPFPKGSTLRGNAMLHAASDHCPDGIHLLFGEGVGFHPEVDERFPDIREPSFD